jgi:hypothetical protein
MRTLRPAPLCRAWLFLEGANGAVLRVHALRQFE